MNAESQKAPRRKRKVQRVTPAIIEQRRPEPFIFGWGTHLDRRQREAIKERIALFSGIALAIILFALIGWGWYQDNVAAPAAQQAKNDRVVALVGGHQIRYGFFHNFVAFQKSQMNQTLTQYQQELAQLQANKTKNSGTITQLNAQISQIQQQMSSVATLTLQEIIDDYTVIKRGYTAGVPLTKKVKTDAIRKADTPLGGKLHLINLLSQNGISFNSFLPIIYGDYVRSLIQTKLSAGVKTTELKVRASHILIKPNNKPLALKVLHLAQSGQNFAQLAKKYSIDTTSAAKGGDLGFFTKTAMVKPFADKAFSMKVGQIQLVKSQFGWHIIKVTGREVASLTPQELSSAQQSAYTTWLNKQESAVHVEKIMNVAALPGLQPTAIPGVGSSGIPGIGNTGSTGSTGNNPVPPSTGGNSGSTSGSSGKVSGSKSSKK